MKSSFSLPHVGPELLKFGTVGVSNFLIGLVVFTCAFRLSVGSHVLNLLGSYGTVIKDAVLATGATGINGVVAQCFAYILGTANSYFWNARWTFKQSHSRVALQRFIVLNLANLAISSLAIFLLVDLIGYNALLSWLGVMVLVTVSGFLGSKLWVFHS